MFRRYMLFFGVNILIVVSVSLIMNIFGIQPYLTSYGINYESLMIFCLIWGMGGSIISLLLSKHMAKWMMRVETVTASGPYGQIVQMVHSCARKAGLDSMPEVGIYQSPDVNAFATGPSKRSALVAVSTGLLNRLSSDEVEGVIAHEVSHIANGDMVTMTLIQGVINAFVMFFARIAAFAVSQAMRGDNERGEGLGFIARYFLIMFFEIVFGILGSIVVAYFSRWREFRADSGGAQLAGKQKMIAALERLRSDLPSMQPTKEAAFQSLQISSKSKLGLLFSTHPPLEERIEALKRS